MSLTTLSLLLRDFCTAIDHWMQKPSCWIRGDKRLGNQLDEAFLERLTYLKALLAKNGFNLQCADVARRWEYAIAQLNSDSLADTLNYVYAGKEVAPYDACDDCWPEDGASSIHRLLTESGAMCSAFSPATSTKPLVDSDFVDSDFIEPRFKYEIAEMFDVHGDTISEWIKRGQLRIHPDDLKRPSAKKIRVHGDEFSSSALPVERLGKLRSKRDRDTFLQELQMSPSKASRTQVGRKSGTRRKSATL
jgi:hypothetical protein